MVVFTPDVLTMTVEIGEHGYPSLNSIGANGARMGAKSVAYHRLYNAVLDLGEQAVSRGWKMVEYDCVYTVTRYCMRNAPRDALNIGHVEANALTRARVWADDRLAVDPHPSWRLDRTGPERVVIIVQRLPQVGAQKAAGARPFTRRGVRRKVGTPESIRPPLPPGVGRVALLKGKPFPADEALEMIRTGRARVR